MIYHEEEGVGVKEIVKLLLQKNFSRHQCPKKYQTWSVGESLDHFKLEINFLVNYQALSQNYNKRKNSSLSTL